MIAAAVVRQPYRPTIGHNITRRTVELSHRGSRKTKNANINAAVVIRQPYSPTIGHNITVGTVGLSHCGSRKQKSPFFIKPIQFPFHRIMLDILGNVVHFRPIPNDMVMESWLPHE